MEQATDHDNLVTLIANVKTLTKSQENFHAEVKEAFRDLKDNYSSRIDKIELRCTNIESECTSYNLVRKIVYSFVALVLTAVGSSIIYLVVEK